MTSIRSRLNRLRALQRYWDASISNVPPDDLARLRGPLDQPTLDLLDGIRTTQVSPVPDLAFLSRMENDIMDAFMRAQANPVPIRSGVQVRQPGSSGRSLPRPVMSRPGWIAAAVTVVLVAAVLIYSLWPSGDQPVIIAPDTTETPAATSVATPEATAPAVTMYRGNLARDGVMPGPAPTGAPSVLWRFKAADFVESSVQVADGMAYVGSDDGVIHAIDITTGDEIWRLATVNQGESAFTIVDGDVVYTAGTDGMARALDAATGAEIWSSDPALPISEQITVADDTVFVGGTDASYYALNKADGSLKWTAALGASPRSRAVVYINNTLYFGANDGMVYALDGATGAIKWTFTSGLEGVGSLSYANGTVFAPATTTDPVAGAMIAISADTGIEQWRYETDSATVAPATPYQGAVLVGFDNGTLRSIDATTGEVNWTYANGTAADIPGAAAIVDGVAYFGSSSSTMTATDASTGDLVWSVRLDGTMNITPAIIDGVLYVGTGSGSIYALGDGGINLPVGDAPAEASPVASPLALPATPAAAIPTGEASLQWSTNASPDNLLYPSVITMAPDGTIWVADTGNSRFQIFSPDGTRIETWGTQGFEPGQFQLQQKDGDGFGAVSFAEDGSFFVLDAGNIRVQKFTADRVFVAAWGDDATQPGALVSPIAIDVGPDGSVYVLDEGTSDIKVFDGEGAFLRTVDLENVPDNGGLGFTVAPNGTFYLACALVDDPDKAQILHADASGNLLDVIGSDIVTSGIMNVTLDAAGRIYVTGFTDVPVIAVLTPDGELLAMFGPPEGDLSPMQLPWGIGTDGEGSIYVTDAMANVLMGFHIDTTSWPTASEATTTT